MQEPAFGSSISRFIKNIHTCNRTTSYRPSRQCQRNSRFPLRSSAKSPGKGYQIFSTKKGHKLKVKLLCFDQKILTKISGGPNTHQDTNHSSKEASSKDLHNKLLNHLIFSNFIKTLSKLILSDHWMFSDHRILSD